jgi:hypothetical protein
MVNRIVFLSLISHFSFLTTILSIYAGPTGEFFTKPFGGLNPGEKGVKKMGILILGRVIFGDQFPVTRLAVWNGAFWQLMRGYGIGRYDWGGEVLDRQFQAAVEVGTNPPAPTDYKVENIEIRHFI